MQTLAVTGQGQRFLLVMQAANRRLLPCVISDTYILMVLALMVMLQMQSWLKLFSGIRMIHGPSWGNN